MAHDFPPDLIDGREVPALVVDDDGALPTGHAGTIHVTGASVVLTGTHKGSLWLHRGADLTLKGIEQGSLHVGSSCNARVLGIVEGSVQIAAGGALTVEAEGQHQGSLNNDGLYVLRGTRGGSVSGSGVYVEHPGSVVRQPEIRDGVAVYVWRN